jgi:uncharacterized protein YjbI with pentapeptide repeats
MSQAESVSSGLTLSGLSLSGLTLSGLTLSGLSLEQRIQRWVQLDNTVKQLNDQVRELRDSRNVVESSILTHVANNNLSHATVRIKDGTLKFAFNVKQPPALTLAFLGEALGECCPPQQAAAIMQHVRAKRDAAAKLVPEIRRTGT